MAGSRLRLRGRGREDETVGHSHLSRGAMFRPVHSQKGFILIELMIVAAIAIPNYLQYQLKTRGSEAKTNLGALKTSEVASEGQNGCYLAVARRVLPHLLVEPRLYRWPGILSV